MSGRSVRMTPRPELGAGRNASIEVVLLVFRTGSRLRVIAFTPLGSSANPTGPSTSPSAPTRRAELRDRRPLTHLTTAYKRPPIPYARASLRLSPAPEA